MRTSPCMSMARPPRTAAVRGFTLVELMVVIGILVLLVGLLVPAVTSTLESGKSRQTLATMKAVEAALDVFMQEKPLERSRVTLRLGATGCTSYPTDPHAADDIFGPWPPSPTSPLAVRMDDRRVTDPPLSTPWWNTAPAWSAEDPAEGDVSTTFTKSRLLHQLAFGRDYPGSGRPAVGWKDFSPRNRNRDDYGMSSECLLLLLTQLSHSARGLIEALPEQARANQDKDLVYVESEATPDGSYQPDPPKREQGFDLFELVDAWGNPIRYQVKERMYRIDAACRRESPAEFEAVWELRSGGPNGRVATPFSREDDKDPLGQSDDVFLRR